MLVQNYEGCVAQVPIVQIQIQISGHKQSEILTKKKKPC